MALRTELETLINAIDHQEDTSVAALLSSHPELAQAVVAAEHGHQQTLLHRAIPGDGQELTPARLVIITRLLDVGASVDARGWGPNHGYCTPLTLAAWGGQDRE